MPRRGLVTYLLGWPWVFLALVPAALAAAALTPSCSARCSCSAC
jgi:hypothetical protein